MKIVEDQYPVGCPPYLHPDRAVLRAGARNISAVEKVSVSKGVLVGVVGVAAASLLALAYQLGKASGSEGVPAPATRSERTAPRPAEQPPSLQPRVAGLPADQAVERPGLAPASTSQWQAVAPQAAARQAPAPVESGASDAGSDPARASVAAYFDTVERIQVASASGNAETVGQEMASALASGDTSSLDKMIRETEAAKASLAAVVPPAPCAAHHRESLASLDDALDVLRSLKAAMESSDPVAQLGAVTTKGQALRTRADFLQKEELALRERYGLKR